MREVGPERIQYEQVPIHNANARSSVCSSESCQRAENANLRIELRLTNLPISRITEPRPGPKLVCKPGNAHT